MTCYHCMCRETKTKPRQNQPKYISDKMTISNLQPSNTFHNSNTVTKLGDTSRPFLKGFLMSFQKRGRLQLETRKLVGWPLIGFLHLYESSNLSKSVIVSHCLLKWRALQVFRELCTVLWSSEHALLRKLHNVFSALSQQLIVCAFFSRSHSCTCGGCHWSLIL